MHQNRLDQNDMHMNSYNFYSDARWITERTHIIAYSNYRCMRYSLYWICALYNVCDDADDAATTLLFIIIILCIYGALVSFSPCICESGRRVKMQNIHTFGTQITGNIHFTRNKYSNMKLIYIWNWNDNIIMNCWLVNLTEMTRSRTHANIH